MTAIFSAPHPIYPAAQLPLTLINLHDWALSAISGADSSKYLQGQITADVNKLSEHQHVMAAHCDAKGKMWSAMHLFRQGDGFAWIERRSLQDRQLAELKKYAVFSKVAISAEDDAILLGVAGAGARAALATQFPQLPDAATPLQRHQHTTLLWFPFPAERFLLITHATQAQQLAAQLHAQSPGSIPPHLNQNNSDQWLALDTEAGYPLLNPATCQQFLPQACNLQAFGGISFKKGCYTGQEMVSRAKFRGANKRALWCLAGLASRLPVAGEDLEMQLANGWRRTGTVLAAVSLADNSVLIQAVMNNDLPADSVFRVRDSDGGVLHIRALPYHPEDNA